MNVKDYLKNIKTWERLYTNVYGLLKLPKIWYNIG